jgi:hypothetical protein
MKSFLQITPSSSAIIITPARNLSLYGFLSEFLRISQGFCLNWGGGDRPVKDSKIGWTVAISVIDGSEKRYMTYDLMGFEPETPA